MRSVLRVKTAQTARTGAPLLTNPWELTHRCETRLRVAPAAHYRRAASTVTARHCCDVDDEALVWLHRSMERATVQHRSRPGCHSRSRAPVRRCRARHPRPRQEDKGTRAHFRGCHEGAACSSSTPAGPYNRRAWRPLFVSCSAMTTVLIGQRLVVVVRLS